MRFSVIAASELDAGACAAWRALQASNPALVSPFFAPEFTQAVAAQRPDARIAVLEDGGGIAGFLPFQARWGMGRPAGAPLSDHHGMVCAPGMHWDWRALLRAARLAYWQFDHLPASQAPGAGAQACESPALDLSQGFEAWKRRRLAAGARRMGELDRKARKLAREVGPLRFEAHVRDPAVFERVLVLKSQQCRRTGVADFLAPPWARQLVTRLWEEEASRFAGRLSALWAGDSLVAAHLGLRGEAAWHWWLPVYEAQHARHSPGALLLMQVAQAAADAGCGLLDLGKGEDAYKASFADCALPLAEGWVARTTAAALLRGAVATAVDRARSSSLVRPLRPLVRRVRRMA